MKKYNKNIPDDFQMLIANLKIKSPRKVKSVKSTYSTVHCTVYVLYSRAYCPRLVNKISKEGKIREELIASL